MIFSFFLNFLLLFSNHRLLFFNFLFFYFIFLFFEQANSASQSSAAGPWFFTFSYFFFHSLLFHIFFIFVFLNFFFSYFFIFFFIFFCFFFYFCNLANSASGPRVFHILYHLVLNIDIDIKYLNILISFFKLGQLSISELCRWPPVLARARFCSEGASCRSGWKQSICLLHISLSFQIRFSNLPGNTILDSLLFLTSSMLAHMLHIFNTFSYYQMDYQCSATPKSLK